MNIYIFITYHCVGRRSLCTAGLLGPPMCEIMWSGVHPSHFKSSLLATFQVASPSPPKPLQAQTTSNLPSG